ncbi:glycosyltransferase [Candidatus Bathyarchaeota archaeon]|nr:glycosyltransferase [Candidatus Bathyarchaeota archaeon]
MSQSLHRIGGHKVTRFGYREKGQGIGRDRMLDELVVEGNKADVVIICKGFGGGDDITIVPEAIRSIGKQTVYWYPDCVEVAGMYPIDMALACDVVCATSLVSCNAFENYGHTKVNQIFEGFDPTVFAKRETEKKRNVTFVGSADGDRGLLLTALESSDIPVDRPSAWTVDLSWVYSETRVALNFVRGEIFSDRVVQILASGAFCLTQGCRDLWCAFEPRRELDVFMNWSDLVQKVKYWVENEDEREAIAATGHEAVQRFCWDEQMAKLVSVLEGESVSDGAFVPGGAT